MKFNILFFQLVLFSSLIIISISDKPKKKHKKKTSHKNTTLPNGLPIPDTVHPDYIPPEVFCETCRAVVNEALKELRTKTREADVYDYLSNACVEERYIRYAYIPKDIQRTCGVFLDAYHDEVVKLLMKRNVEMNNEDIINNFCDEYTQICKGVEVDYEKTFYKVHRQSENEIDGGRFTLDIHGNNEQDRGYQKQEKKEPNKNKKEKNKKKKHSHVTKENNDL